MTTYGKPQADKIIAMHESGTSAKIISKALDIPLYRVNAILRAAKHNRPFLDQVYEMKSRGMTDSDIARALGKSKQYISRLTVQTRRAAKKDTIHREMNIDPGAWVKCMEIAESFGLIAEDGQFAGRGSPKKLLEQIGIGNLSVIRTGALGDLI